VYGDFARGFNDVFNEVYYMMNLGIPFKNYLGTPNSLVWSLDNMKLMTELYVQYHNAVVDFIDNTGEFTSDSLTPESGSSDTALATSSISERLDIDEIWKPEFDDMEFDEIVVEMCNGTILAEVFAFYDVFYGPIGVIP
jgi:hypothetical protein